MYRLFRAAVQSASMKVLKDEGFSSCAWRKGADHSVTCQKTCLRFIPDVFSESKFVCVQTYLIQSHALVSVLLSQLLTLVNTALGEKQTNNKKKWNKQHCFPVPLSLLPCSAKCSYLERNNKIYSTDSSLQILVSKKRRSQISYTLCLKFFLAHYEIPL